MANRVSVPASPISVEFKELYEPMRFDYSM